MAGAAYLPYRLVEQHLASNSLFILGGVPEFTRRVYFSRNDEATSQWQWLDQALGKI